MKPHLLASSTKAVLCTLALPLFLPSLFAENAKETTVKVGSASIRLVAPADYSNYSDENDPIRNFAENFCPPGNRLLGVFASKEFGRKALAGETTSDFDYALVQIARGSVWLDASARDFADVTRELKQSQDTLVSQADPEVKEFMNRLSRNIEQTTGEKFTLNLDQPVSLGVFEESSRHVSMMMLMTMQMQAGGRKESNKVAVSISLLHLNGKIIFVYAYREYNRESTVKALQEFTSDWIRKLTSANEQLASR